MYWFADTRKTLLSQHITNKHIVKWKRNTIQRIVLRSTTFQNKYSKLIIFDIFKEIIQQVKEISSLATH